MSDLVLRTEADNYLPVMSVAEALDRKRMIQEYTAGLMVDGEDYGVIPGAGTKKVLLKPGAEKLIRIFGLTPRFSDVKIEEDWTGEAHGGEMFFAYTIKCSLYRQERFMGDADGSCNSWEKKYRYASSQRLCPICGAGAIIAGKKEYGGGFICFEKKGGCKAKFGDNDTRITSQSLGQIPDPDIADKVNTIRKMAEKRALVAACLITVGASEFFTQDIEPERPAPQDRPQQAYARPAPPQHQEEVYEAEYVPQEDRDQTWGEAARGAAQARQQQRPPNVEADGVVHDNVPTRPPASPRQQAYGAFRRAARAIEECYGHPSFNTERMARMVAAITESGKDWQVIAQTEMDLWEQATAVLQMFHENYPDLVGEQALKTIQANYKTDRPMCEFSAPMWDNPYPQGATTAGA